MEGHHRAAGKILGLTLFNPDNATFEVGREAIDVIRGFNRPVAFVTVAGRDGQGENFLLNNILGTRAFQNSSGKKGLFMWSSPMECQAPDGNNYLMVCHHTPLLLQLAVAIAP